MKKVILSFVVCMLTASSFAQERPNIIFLLSDDQTSIATGCYGNDQVITPNMDNLAEEGVLFENHYNTTAVCMASRAIILTGMYEYKAGCNFEHGPLRKEKFAKSYPVLLREQGYYTGFAGKFGMPVSDGNSTRHNSWDTLPIDAFDNWAGGLGQTSYQTAKNKYIAKYAKEYPHSTRAYAAWAKDFIAEAKQTNKPFCMSISFKAPHMPFTPDQYFDYVYKGKTYKKPENYGAENATHLAPQAKTGRQYKEYGFWRDSEESYQKTIKNYNQLIHGVDYALGMIRKTLEEQGVADNTIIIFTSDNGYSCGAHNFGGKILAYEEASKSPLIIYDPRTPEKERGVRRAEVTANIDMAPTILNYAGIKAPSNMDGENLSLLIEKPKKFKRETVALTNMWGNDEIQAMGVVSKEWKYIYWQYEDNRMKPTEELYHIEKDRLEMTNKVNDPSAAKQLKVMRSLYDEQLDKLKKEATTDNLYQKYAVLFDRDATAEDKKPYLIGTYKASEKKAKTSKPSTKKNKKNKNRNKKKNKKKRD
ncbi:sulfatase family protein [Flavicella sediminum]|uniref:sulfatase family protein n=1 Tax=Flavicella sediminum TaxID=2585141 RepID=UPI0011228BFF|nr:sulfatase [Flavicella sediminum]